MNLQLRPTGTLALLALIGAASAADRLSPRGDDLKALDGEWIYMEDRTEGRPLERLGPPMSSKFSMRVEEGAVVLVSGHGSGHRDVRVTLDGKPTEVAEPNKVARYTGAWKDGVFSYETEFFRGNEKTRSDLIRKEFSATPDGLLVKVAIGSPATSVSTAIYRKAKDIPAAVPIKAAIGDLAWLADAWVGTRGEGGTTSIEERWSPPLGGAMLGVSRTVTRGAMRSFEFLRIVERDGGLVYIAQPGGAAPTEFTLTELVGKRAVFDNPRHDYPKRIVYELSSDDVLSATIGFLKGGTPRRFDFDREAPKK